MLRVWSCVCVAEVGCSLIILISPAVMHIAHCRAPSHTVVKVLAD